MKALHMVAFTLLVIGGLNWGLIGLFKYDLVMSLLGGYPSLVTLVYVLVGLSAVVIAATHAKDCKMCMSK